MIRFGDENEGEPGDRQKQNCASGSQMGQSGKCPLCTSTDFFEHDWYFTEVMISAPVRICLECGVIYTKQEMLKTLKEQKLREIL